MFKGYPAEMCAEKISLTSMRGQTEGLACLYLGVRTPIGVSGIFKPVYAYNIVCKTFDISGFGAPELENTESS